MQNFLKKHFMKRKNLIRISTRRCRRICCRCQREWIRELLGKVLADPEMAALLVIDGIKNEQ